MTSVHSILELALVERLDFPNSIHGGPRRASTALAATLEEDLAPL